MQGCIAYPEDDVWSGMFGECAPSARLQYHISLRVLAGAFLEMWTGERLFCGVKHWEFTNQELRIGGEL